jgi:hypothetical protein
MGLDITAYQYATKADPQPVSDEESWENGDLTKAFVYNGFEHSLRGLEADCWYRVSGATVEFRAGSYSSYGEFRRQLSLAALGASPEEVWRDVDTYRERPFFELVNFADNEGTIGPEACADLAVDFENEREAIFTRWTESPTEEGIYDETSFFRAKYDDWAAAFKLAASTGLVELH